jgi:hypothetical protein
MEPTKGKKKYQVHAEHKVNARLNGRASIWKVCKIFQNIHYLLLLKLLHKHWPTEIYETSKISKFRQSCNEMV